MRWSAAGSPFARADDAVLVAEDLKIGFAGPEGVSTPVREASLTVRHREIVGIVGESGSGKTLVALACASLLPASADLTAERLEFMGRDLRAAASSPSMRRLLGTRLGLVYQNPASALNPAIRVERQLTEAVRQHAGLARREARTRAVERLTAVAMPGAQRRLHRRATNDEAQEKQVDRNCRRAGGRVRPHRL